MAKQIVVIGGGPAGIEAARTAATAGAKVTLITDEPVGGRAGWHSLLPSKVWLSGADATGLVSEAGFMPDGMADPAAIVAQIQAVKERWNKQQADELTALGVKIVSGVASLESTDRVVVKDETGEEVMHVEGEAIILATGSVPIFPPNLRPDGERILAPRFAGGLDKLPQDVVVIGAGPTGTEFVYLFNRLGVQVTWIVDRYGILPTFAPAAGELMDQVLTERGVQVVRGFFADRIESEAEGVAVVLENDDRYEAEMAFVAIGRRPDFGRLDLEAAFLSQEALEQVDEYGRTTAPGLYAVGDAAGPPMVANKGTAQGWVAGRHAAGVDTPPFRPESVIYAVYTDPQVAQVGAVSGEGIQTTRVSAAATLKSHLAGETGGFVELAYDDSKRIVGGVAVAPHAADLLAPVAVAIQLEAKVADLAPLYGAYPTVSELPFIAARQAG